VTDNSRDEYISQLEQQVEDRELEVKLLLEITEAINNRIQIDDLFQAVAERARTLVNAETLLIPILDEQCNEYTYRAGSGINVVEIVGESLPIDFGICGWVWREKRPWWRGVLKELSAADRNRWEKEAGSVLMVPLFGKRHFLGGISAINKVGESEFTRRDLELLTMFANSVTVTIENAMFFEEMEMAQKQSEIYQKELELLNDEQETIIIERTQKLRQSNKALQESIDSLNQTQEQLIQSEKMAALGNLVAGISHEINTPLGVSVTSASYMDEQIKSVENKFKNNQLKKSELEIFFADTHKGFAILLTNLRRSSDLIKNFKQVAVDQSCDELREINLRQYIDEIVSSLQPALKRTPIKINNNIDEQLILNIAPGAIYQIISNLIFNSIVHGFPEGHEFEGAIEINGWRQNNTIMMSYSDNGIGMNEESMNKIFDPFYTTKRGSGSTGLGMSIVYNLVTSTLNGVIRNKSVSGKGVCFEFEICKIN